MSSSILLINPPIREFAKPNNAPLGLLYISSYLEQFGYSVDICDLNAARQFTDNWQEYLAQFNGPYEYTGISGLISTHKWQKNILDFLIANKPKYGKLIIGGGMATFAPDFISNCYPEIDIIVLDEGEQTVLDILNGTQLKDIDGIWYWDEVWLKNPKTKLISDLDSLPFPNYDKVPVHEVYLGNAIWGRATGNSSGINYDMKRSLNMIMSRGCKFNCSFCAHAFKVPGIHFRQRSVDNVLAEIDELVEKYNIDFIGFVDDNVCTDRNWVVEFCIKLIERPYKLHWGCSARVDEVDEQLLELMRHTDCEWIGFGVESIDKQVLKNMRKGNTREYKEQAEHAIRLTKEAGIWCNCTFIIGYPGEDWNSIRKTAKFMSENDVLNNMFYATAYPATRFYQEQKEQILSRFGSEAKYISSLSDATELRVNFTDLSDDELQYARRCAINGKWDLISIDKYKEYKDLMTSATLDPLLNPLLARSTMEGLNVRANTN